MKKKDRFDGVSLVEIRALPSRMNEWMESAWRACTIKREREREGPGSIIRSLKIKTH